MSVLVTYICIAQVDGHPDICSSKCVSFSSMSKSYGKVNTTLVLIACHTSEVRLVVSNILCTSTQTVSMVAQAEVRLVISNILRTSTQSVSVVAQAEFRLVASNTLCTRTQSVSIVAQAEVVDMLKRAGLVVGMCGDGGNDCGALRSAHAGLALSDAEASLVSPFTSKAKSVSTALCCSPHQ